MLGIRNAATVMLVTAALLESAFLSSGCNKTQPKVPAPSSLARPSAPAEKGSNVPEAIPQEALRNVQNGIGHVRSHEYDIAIREFTEAIAQYPQYVMAYNDRAAAYIRQNKFDKAKDDLNKALAINPHNPITYYNTAALYALQKQSAPALEYLDKALVLGFKDYDYLRTDPDLNNIRKNTEFRKILDRHGVFVPK